MLHAAHEGRAPALVDVRHPSHPTNEFTSYSQWRKVPPRKCSRFSGADRFSPCRLHADIYEPIVNYLGIARGIVKRGSALGRAARCRQTANHSFLRFAFYGQKIETAFLSPGSASPGRLGWQCWDKSCSKPKPFLHRLIVESRGININVAFLVRPRITIGRAPCCASASSWRSLPTRTSRPRLEAAATMLPFNMKPKRSIDAIPSA
jgi:hypothetical protein